MITVTLVLTDQTDPQTLSAPTWKVLPGSSEIAIEGRNKTLYCLAIGRLVLFLFLNSSRMEFPLN